MNRYRNLIWRVVLLSGILIIISGGVAQAQEETHIKGRIAFDYPRTPNDKIEFNLTGKLIGLVAKDATTDLLDMLEGVYVRGYHRGDAHLGEVKRYYENKLTKEGWNIIAKVKEADEMVEVRVLSHQDVVNGLFILAEGGGGIMFINIFGRINPQMIGELFDSLDINDLGNFDIDLADMGMEFEFNLPEFDADFKPKRKRVPSGNREFSEQLDWTLDGAGISVISAETRNGKSEQCA